MSERTLTLASRPRFTGFLPAQGPPRAVDCGRGLLGGFLGILCAGLLGRLALGTTGDLPWLVAPLGASAVLVFAVPASPLAQPWSVVGGNVISALMGIACARWIPDPALTGAAAVSLAIGAMFVLRCLHPPGGAMALIAVMTH